MGCVLVTHLRLKNSWFLKFMFFVLEWTIMMFLLHIKNFGHLEFALKCVEIKSVYTMWCILSRVLETEEPLYLGCEFLTLGQTPFISLSIIILKWLLRSSMTQCFRWKYQIQRNWWDSTSYSMSIWIVDSIKLQRK